MSMEEARAEDLFAAMDWLSAPVGVLYLPAEQFDELVATLDVPDEAPELARLAMEPRRVARL